MQLFHTCVSWTFLKLTTSLAFSSCSAKLPTFAHKGLALLAPSLDNVIHVSLNRLRTWLKLLEPFLCPCLHQKRKGPTG